MDAAELGIKQDVRQSFIGLKRPCPSQYCGGFLTEWDQVSEKPFKAFLVCPDCESRLRVFKMGEWTPRERIELSSPRTAG